MKKLYFLFFFFSFIVNAQIINIPDANFKAALLSANTNNIASTETPNSNGLVTSFNTIDTNGDGEIQVTEAQVIKLLKVEFLSISDLTGIEAFVNLEALWCGYNQLTSLNLLNNSNTKYLNCKVNNINSLNISSLTNLESFYCSDNQLTSIDLSFYSNLRNLDLGNNQLSIINLSQNPLLFKFYINDNNLTSLDVSFNTVLKDLRAQNNLLANVTMGSNNILEVLGLGYNQLTFIDLTQLPALKGLDLEQNQLSSLNLTQNINLEYLYVNDNNLTSLNTSQNTNIYYLAANSNQITNIDVTQNVALRFLYLSFNQIANIDVTQNTILEEFSIIENLLTNINLTQNLNLIAFSGNTNQFSNLDFSQNSNLQYLWCNENELTTLDVTANSALITLNCMDNTPMETLFMKNNNATAWSILDFSGNPNLEFVCCDNDDLAIVQQKIIDYSYTTCQVSNLSCDYPTLYEVSGNVQYDYFENGCNSDIDDLMVPNVKYEIFDGTSTVITSGNQIGNYYIPLGTGNYTITPVIENPNYFTISPTNFTVNFPTDASPFEQNVCLTWNGLEYYDDLEVTILPTTPARPGFEAKYKVIVRNKGFDETNGTVTLSYDNSILTYVSSAPVFNSSNTNTISWDFYSLPFLTLEFDVVFNLNSPSDSPAVNIDDELHFTANVIHDWTDYTPADNTFTLDQIVVGSYDPNDKTCLQGETEEVSIVGEYVHYMIRFENTGTFAAQTVRIEDIIDTSKFDISTLIPLQASHSFYTKINGNLVEFVFDNINLDYNAPNNGGYIAFKIKLLPTLTIGDTFSNSSNIYFDANPAIITNTYTTTIVAALANQSFSENEFTIYPNPASSILNIQSKNDLEIQSVEIYNILGQIVLAVSNNTNAIDVSSLISGTYFIKVNTENGSINTRFVKE